MNIDRDVTDHGRDATALAECRQTKTADASNRQADIQFVVAIQFLQQHLELDRTRIHILLINKNHLPIDLQMNR